MRQILNFYCINNIKLTIIAKQLCPVYSVQNVAYITLFAREYFYLVYNVRFTLLVQCKLINVLKGFINETFIVTSSRLIINFVF